MLATSAAALAEPAAVPKEFMRVFGPAQPPYGFVDFCKRAPRECMRTPQEEHRFDASPERLAELDAVNRIVNHEIEPVTDRDLYGQEEHWAIPTRKGDCEDYVLLKRKRLMELGWPASALLITVVRDEIGKSHAVLTARTRQGDYILDNKTDEIKPWYRVHYQFVMRQSYLDPTVWVSLDPKERPQSLPLAGVR
jgi:predicted transglutaminase-like cysteine proteinase